MLKESAEITHTMSFRAAGALGRTALSRQPSVEAALFLCCPGGFCSRLRTESFKTAVTDSLL